MAIDFSIPFKTQLDYMMHELRGPEKRTMSAFQSGGAITPQDYAELFEKTYERAGGHGLERRKQYALEVFNSVGTDAFGNLPKNVQTAYNYFTGQGFKPEQAAGIVGNLMTESYAHLDPNAYNPAGGGKGAYGIAQFRGSRLQGLLDFAGQQGVNNMNETVGMPLQAKMNGNKPEEKKSGIRGLLDFASERNPETGLTRFQMFAAALDPLIMQGMRGGDAIRAQGQARVQSAKLNKTVDWLKKNGYGDIASVVEQNPKTATNVMSAILAQRIKPTEQFRVATPEEAAQYGAIAGQFGKDGRFYPTSKIDKTQVVGDKSAFTEAGQKALAQSFAEAAALGREAGANIGKIKMLSQLLDQSDTGITAGFASRANQLFGVDFRSDAAAAAEAMISQLVPQQRPPGSGVISDADLALYKASLPAISTRPGGNALIIQSMMAIAEHNQKVGRISSKALTDPNYSLAQAEEDIAALPDPFMSVREYIGSEVQAPTPTLTGEGAMDILREEGVID